MSDNKMLIDATHPEETRVVVLRDGRVEEFDYESAARRLLRGSIYLAKITRVEPSLQAAFVDYGGNRHGFLAFNEIHPDYYQIPHSDRQALLEEQQAAQRRRDEEDDIDLGDDDVDPDSGSVVEVDTHASSEDEDDDADDHDNGERDSGETAVLADTDDDNDDDGPDPEDTALDVTHLLPPEVPEDKHEAGSSDAPSSGADRAADVDQRSDVDQPGDDNVDEGSTDRKPPKSIAASMNDNDKIVSDIVVPDDAADAASADADAPVEAVPTTAAAPTGEHTETEQRTESEPDVATSAAAAPAPADEANEARDDHAVAHSDDHADTDDADDGTSEDDDATETDDDGETAEAAPRSRRRGRGRRNQAKQPTEQDDIPEPDVSRPRRRARSYKIQEVIKRRQIVLIQVVKEERGNKGAALTTYLSLAGRYTVLMPNTARGGGISRKITNMQDRKRLKAIAQELDVPEGMGLIIRTAGASRTKQEIKRDFEYLLRLWENVRDLTLQSTAPSLVYEEGDLIKRSIRDLYTKDIDQILVAGGDAHREAKSFMRMLMPSHAKNVIKYEDPQPLFAKYGIESQLNAMFSPLVQLRSGGYLVINQTEALVAVDVNSGKATKEFSIEETALKTNLEAAEELSRQLKLRDLAGLIVVDFIDMEEKRNNRSVERKLKECLRHDRARIQVGRISHFGLLEMSRQRLRTGVLEGSTMQCAHCLGTGTIRSTESVALAVLRSLEDALMSGQPRSLLATTAPNVALYLLNHKRGFIQDMEARYGIVIHVQASDAQQGANFTIERLQTAALGESGPQRRQDNAAVSMQTTSYNDDDEAPALAVAAATTEEDGDEPRSRRRRRRRRRDERGGDRPERVAAEDHDDNDADDDRESADDDFDANRGDADTRANANARADDDAGGDDAGEGGRRRPRRRGRRGGRRNREQRAVAADGVAVPGAPQPDITFQDGFQERSQDHASDGRTAAEPGPTGETEQAAQSNLGGTEQNASEQNASGPNAGISSEADIASAEAEAAAQPDAMVSHDESQAAQAPEPVEPKPVTASTAAEPVAAPDGDVADDKPAATDAPASNGHDVAKAQDEPTTQPDENTEAVLPRRSPGASPIATEPRLERVVVSPDKVSTDDSAARADDASDEADKPSQKKGWWQRRFGG